MGSSPESLADRYSLVEIRVARPTSAQDFRLQFNRVSGQLGVNRAAVQIGGQLHGQSCVRRRPVYLVQNRVLAEGRSAPESFLDYASLRSRHCEPKDPRNRRRDVHIRGGERIVVGLLEVWTARHQ